MTEVEPVDRRADAQSERRDTGPLTSRGRARRDELLAAARRVFERDGYLETRVVDITDEAGASQGTFYTYFESKETIFYEVAEQAIGEVLDQLHSDEVPSEPIERIRAALKRFFDAYRPAAPIIALVEQVGTIRPDVKAMRLAMREAFVQRTIRGITRWQREGIADTTIDLRLTAEALGSMLDHLCYVWHSLGVEFEEEPLLDTLTLLWARTVGVEGAAPVVRAVPAPEDDLSAQPAPTDEPTQAEAPAPPASTVQPARPGLPVPAVPRS